MHEILRMSTFFGSAVDEVLADYRRIRRAESESASVDAELADLQSRRTAVAEEHAEEILRLRSLIAKVEQRLAGLRKELAGPKRERVAESCRIGSFWKILGLEIRRKFVKGAAGVKDTRLRIEQLRRQIERIEDEIDDALDVLDSHRRSLRRLTDPIADLDYAIGYLEQRRDDRDRYRGSLHERIDETIRTTARNTRPAVLQQKLSRLPGGCNRGGFGRRVLELKEAATQADLLRQAAEIEESPADAASTLESIRTAIFAGMYYDATRGSGQLAVSGNGTTHVRKTRTVTRTDSKGRVRLHTESYWDEVRVKFSGQVRASFEVSFSRWSEKTAAAAIHAQMQQWIRAGRNRALSGWPAELLGQLQGRVAQLTAELRSELENDFQDVRG